MKNRWLLVVGAPLVFCMAFTGCPTGNGTDGDPANKDPKSITITGVSGEDIPEEYDSVRIRVLGGRGVSVAGHDELHIDDATETIKTPLFIVPTGDTIPAESPAWTGSGKHYIAIYFDDDVTFVYADDKGDLKLYDFTDAETSIEFSNFKKQDS
jgi:hypothetical protein